MDHDTPSPIIPNLLWQSGEMRDHPERIEENKIDVILNLSYYPDPEKIQRSVSEYLQWGFDDGRLPDLEQLWRTVNWVCGALRAGRRVLVHCDAGLNRSGLVCALVVRVLRGLGGAYAVELVRICRGKWALCNETFVTYIKSADATEAANASLKSQNQPYSTS
jgi:protein-tyrosine phosphatase